jgi:hypothetical protein
MCRNSSRRSPVAAAGCMITSGAMQVTSGTVSQQIVLSDLLIALAQICAPPAPRRAGANIHHAPRREPRSSNGLPRALAGFSSADQGERSTPAFQIAGGLTFVKFRAIDGVNFRAVDDGRRALDYGGDWAKP